MKRILRSLLLLAVTAVTASTTQAAPVTYTFTATLADVDTPYFNPYFGVTLTGTVTLDPSAIPIVIAPIYIDGEYRKWVDGAFTINIITDTGYMAGTADGGTTSFENSDIPLYTAVEDRSPLV